MNNNITTRPYNPLYPYGSESSSSVTFYPQKTLQDFTVLELVNELERRKAELNVKQEALSRDKEMLDRMFPETKE